MLNRSTVDLDSATVRTRYFGGRSAASIAEEMPILPVDAPGLASPGPSFQTFAITLGDQPSVQPAKKGRGKAQVVKPGGEYLHALIRSVLYQSGLAINVVNHPTPYVFQPGVLAESNPMGDEYGPKPCRLMVVGKSLGRDEVNAGRPFVGPGSKPLWEAWKEAGLPNPSQQEPVYLTNLIRFQPPRDLERLPSQWVADGLHLLQQEIALCRPQVILVLGGDALKALCGNKAKIADYRGRVAQFELDCRPMPDAPPDIHHARIVATEHPAAVSREPDILPNLVAGFKLAARELGYCPPAQSITLDHQPVYTIQELKAAVAESVRESAAGGYISFDCEWEGRHPSDPGAYLYTLQWSHAPGHARVVFMRRCGGGANSALPIHEATPLLKQLFEQAPKRGARLVAHFGKADLPWLLSVGVDLYPHFINPEDDPPGTPMWLDRSQKSYFEGGFDTYVAGHAVEESQPLGLEVMLATHCNIERYDIPLIQWKEEYCRKNKIKKSQLKGYGNVPEQLMIDSDYAAMDCDGAGRLYLKLNGDPRKNTTGMLDADRYGFSCRKIYATRMRAWGAWAEMERYGLGIDRNRQRELREALLAKKNDLIEKLRTEAQWPDLDLDKNRHKVEFLFGEEWIYWPQQRPATALSLYLKPYRATDAKGEGRLWDEAVALYENDPTRTRPSPSADQETIIHKAREHELAGLVRDILFINTAMKIVFRLPDEEESDVDDEGNFIQEETFDAGLLSLVCGDERIRSRFGFVETGRSSSSGPNLQNCLLPGAEYLTDRGWVMVEELGSEDKVAQFDPTTEEISFVKPSAVIVKPWDGDVISLRTEEQIRLTVTPDHRILTRNRRRLGSWSVTSPCDVAEDRLYYHAGKYSGGGTKLSWAEVSLLCAIQADGSWCAGHNQVIFRFKKRRKYVRLTEALRDLGMEWNEHKTGSDDRYSVYLGEGKDQDSVNSPMLSWARGLLGEDKEFGKWILDFDQDTLLMLAEELYHWDGLYTRKSETFSSDKVSADWMQIVFTLTGVRARMRGYHNGNPNSRVCHIVSTPTRRVPYSMTTNIEKIRHHYRGDVHCVTVPTGFIVVREHGKVSVTGNCSSRRDDSIERILEWGDYAPKESPNAAKRFVTRSVFCAQPGWFLVFADLKGAEIIAAAVFSGDPTLLEHSRRNNLPEDHPDYLDLHSDLANKAFKLNLPYSEIKKKHKPLRVAAKATRFGGYYGASAETILRQALEETPDVTLEQIEDLMRGHDAEYPQLIKFFRDAENRPQTPGWMANCYGGRRRFRRASARDRQAGQGREAKNWTCQGLVADAMNVALGNVWHEFRRRKMRSRILLSVHDSGGFECPPDEVEEVVDEILPLCFKDLLTITPTDLNGIPNGRPDCRFDIDVEVFRSWGVEIPESEWRTGARTRKGVAAA